MKNYIGYIISPASTKLNEIGADERRKRARTQYYGTAPLTHKHQMPRAKKAGPIAGVNAVVNQLSFQQDSASKYSDFLKRRADVLDQQGVLLDLAAERVIETGEFQMPVELYGTSTYITRMTLGRGGFVQTVRFDGNRKLRVQSQLLDRTILRDKNHGALHALIKMHMAGVIAELTDS